MTSTRDDRDEDVVALDRYLDDHLARATPGPAPLPGDTATDVDPDLARAARVVGMALARFHPSFRFEERLAARLRAEAGRTDPMTHPEAHGGPGVVIPFTPPGRPTRSRSRRVNGALIGGAISAGVSIASLAAGALVARRRRGDTRWERVV